jgi:hypothetical protein
LELLSTVPPFDKVAVITPADPPTGVVTARTIEFKFTESGLGFVTVNWRIETELEFGNCAEFGGTPAIEDTDSMGGVAVGVGVIVGVFVGVSVGVKLGVKLGVKVNVIVGVSVGVFVGVKLGVKLGVKVGVSVGVNVGVSVGVKLGVAVGVSVGVAVGVLVGSATVIVGPVADPVTVIKFPVVVAPTTPLAVIDVT